MGLYGDNPLAKAEGLSLHTGTQTMLYLSLFFPVLEVCMLMKACLTAYIMLGWKYGLETRDKRGWKQLEKNSR